ncbi:trypsin-like peptidase domain-containing protein [Micromonospora costi]|nr:trypsin-like peptidase domain-containing protein [Micromonospora costi]
MTTALEALLRQCTVLLLDEHESGAGTGFFVAENLILTAAHVVLKADGKVRGRWGGTTLGPLEVAWCRPERAGVDGRCPLPDLALLRVVDDSAAGHPCVRLGDHDPGPNLLADGYTRGVAGGLAADSARLRFESFREESGYELIKAKDSIIDDGFSGGPLLDLTTGDVVGVTKAQRAGRLPLGGIAVGVRTIRDRFPELWAANGRFHRADRRWEFARLCGASTQDAGSAVGDLLTLVRDTVRQRPVIVPSRPTSADVHQIPSVRAERGAGAASAAPVGTSSVDDGGTWHDDGVFRWAPLRVRWPAAVLSGMPGVGKSYLLNTHAEALAADGLERLAEPDAAPLALPVPILVDCAALGAALPDRASRDGVIGALLDTFRAAAEPDPDGHDWSALGAVARLAYADGRLVTCLDALDEAGVRERERVLRALTYLAERGNRVVVTSRPQPRLRDDTAKLAGCFRGEVVGFSPGQTFAFARAWFHGEPGLAERFEAGLKDRSELRDLGRVPLLAAFLCRLVSEGDDVNALPTSAATLYEAVVAAALRGQWRDASRRAVDPDNPPDAGLRLRVLTDALAALTRTWRSRVDRFPVPDFDDGLAAHPHHRRAVLAAEARMAAWAALQPHDRGPQRHPSPLRWEYLFDGLLVHDAGDGGNTMLRFAHPVLGEYCVAAHVAGLDDDALRDVVQEHRWFDPSWDQIWPLSAALMDEPDRLVRLFLDTEGDAWHEQLFLAARCVVGAVERIAPDLAGRVVSEVAGVARAWHPFDRDRALTHLGELVRAGVPGAVGAARELAADTALRRRTRLYAAAALAEVADGHGLKVARESVADRGVPTTYRAWLARAVVLSGDQEGLDKVAYAVRHARQVGELRLLLAAIPVEIKAGADLVESVLRDHNAPLAIRAAAGRALIRIASAHTVTVAKSLAADPLTQWTLRADLIADLLAIGEVDLIPDGVTVLHDPSVTGAPAVALLESLVRSGETAVLRYARTMLGSRHVEWWHRRRLAEAVVELGAEGVELLRGLVDSALAVDLKLRPLVALVEVGLALDVANRVVGDPGAPAWIRTRVARALLRAGDQAIDLDAVTELACEPEPDHHFQGELIAAMAERELAQAEPAAIALLKRQRDGAGNGTYSGDKALTGALATVGRGGTDLLSRIAATADLAEEDRALAVIGLADVDPALAGRLAGPLLDQFTAFVRSRVVIILAEKGATEIAGDLTALLATDPEAYTALFKLLEGTRADRELIARHLALGREPSRQPPRADGRFQLDDAYLEGCGLTWTSAAQRNRLHARVWDLLQTRVGAKLVAFLTSGQVAEFEELSSDEERREFLASRASGYEELVDHEAAQVQRDVREGRVDVDDREELAPLPLLSYTAALLAEWLDTIRTKGHAAAVEFLRANQAILVSREALTVLDIARQIDRGYGVHEGLFFIVSTASEQGLPAATQFLLDRDHRHDVYCALLAEDNGNALLYAGLGGMMLSPESASTYFYAALGATMVGLTSLGVTLMRSSDRFADDEQRGQGRTTIRREGQRLGWSAEVVRDLLEALRPPKDGEAEADPQ